MDIAVFRFEKPMLERVVRAPPRCVDKQKQRAHLIAKIILNTLLAIILEWDFGPKFRVRTCEVPAHQFFCSTNGQCEAHVSTAHSQLQETRALVAQVLQLDS